MFSSDHFHPSGLGYARVAAVLLPSALEALGIATSAAEHEHGHAVTLAPVLVERAARDAARVPGTAVGPADSGPGGLRGRLASAWRDIRWVRPDTPESDADAGPSPDNDSRGAAEPTA